MNTKNSAHDAAGSWTPPEGARMVLLSWRGFTVQEIMEVFEVVGETLYRGFDRFDAEGPEGPYDRERNGRPAGIGEETQSELKRLLEHAPEEEGYDFTIWTTPLLKTHLREQMGIDVSTIRHLHDSAHAASPGLRLVASSLVHRLRRSTLSG